MLVYLKKYIGTFEYNIHLNITCEKLMMTIDTSINNFTYEIIYCENKINICLCFPDGTCLNECSSEKDIKSANDRYKLHSSLTCRLYFSVAYKFTSIMNDIFFTLLNKDI